MEKNLKDIVYFDHASSTPIDPKVLDLFIEHSQNNFANPNSTHYLGQQSKYIYNLAKANIAKFLNVDERELIFTSGSTQSNFLFFDNFFETMLKDGGNFITSPIEHDSISELIIPANVQVKYLELDHNGHVLVESLIDLIDNDTKFVSLIHAHNEIGTVQNIFQISEVIKEINKKRSPQNRVFFHIDATQSPVFYDLDIQKLGVDSLTIGSQKIYAPRGFGLLYLNKEIKTAKKYTKSNLQQSIFPGTPNVSMAACFALALSICAQKRDYDRQFLTTLRDYFIQRLNNNPLINLNISYKEADSTNYLPNLISFQVVSFELDYILTALDLAGFCVSSGSACSSGSSKIPKSLEFLKQNNYSANDQVSTNIRISLGRSNTKDQIDKFCDVLDQITKNK
jgi:cysteine desulfurase